MYMEAHVWRVKLANDRIGIVLADKRGAQEGPRFVAVAFGALSSCDSYGSRVSRAAGKRQQPHFWCSSVDAFRRLVRSSASSLAVGQQGTERQCGAGEALWSQAVADPRQTTPACQLCASERSMADRRDCTDRR